MERAAELPRGTRKSIGVIACLLISGLCISGGALVIASFMHLVVTSIDMPPGTSTVAIYRDMALQKGAENAIAIVPRHTLQNTLDTAVVRAGDPAGAYIQSDAVDIGWLLQREVHALLTGVFDRATRSQTNNPDLSPGVPLTNGQ